jgi:predicted O-methyltransferase YrrM
MTNYNASWFYPINIDKFLKKFKGKNNLNFLEIGSFEGKGTNYLVENFLQGENSKITCIDPWIKYSESTVTKMVGRSTNGKMWDDLINENTYDIFLKNVKKNENKIIVKRGLSQDILPELKESYDFVYVDGDHSEDAVWVDGTLSFDLLKSGGVMIFDDYKWNSGKKSPKKAVDRFLNEYKEKIKVLNIDRQVSIEKL